MFSETRYAMNGDLRVAYRASGEGARDIVFVPAWFSNCEVFPELPLLQGWLEAMTSLGRMIFFDQPGVGVSDPIDPSAMPSLEQWADSITAVLDDIGSREAVLLAPTSAVAPAALFAATHPSRTTALVVLEGFAGAFGSPEGLLEQGEAATLAMWGTGEYQHAINPDMPWNEEIRASLARVERLSVSPENSRNYVANQQPNGRAVSPANNSCSDRRSSPRRRPCNSSCDGQVHRRAHSERKIYRAAGPQRVPLCRTGLARAFKEIAEFLTGEQPEVSDDRVLATVLFTDIVDSTQRATEMGDRDWHALLDAHDAIVRVQLTRFRGREVNTSGDGFLAMFDGPQRAIRCAMAIRDAVQALGIEVRAGLHTGECEVRGDDIGGIAVHIGARVSALAEPNDVLVSSTLRDLVIGSGLEFEDRGAHQLKGVPGEWHLFAVASGRTT